MAKLPNSDEKPLKLKSYPTAKGITNKFLHQTCIIHYKSNKSQKRIRPLTAESFKTIQDKAEVRRSRGKSHEKLEEICKKIPTTFSPELHGTHEWCYKNFTNVSKILKRKHEEDDGSSSTSRPKRKKKSDHTDETSPLFPPDVCIICNKYRRKVNPDKTEKPIKCQTETAEYSIKAAAEFKEDHEMLAKVTDYDLKVREAHCYPTCRKEYTHQTNQYGHKTEKDSKSKQEQEAHQAAFDYLCHYIDESIFDGSNVERLTMLKEKYLTFLQEERPEFYNPNYKTYKLKDKLILRYGKRLQFWQPNYRGELVYSADIPKGQAVETAFEVAASESKRSCISSSKSYT